MQLRTRTERDWTVLDVDGEVDLSTAPTLRSRIEQLVGEGIRKLVVNLEQVGFLDSSGLSALVAAMRRMQETGGEFVLICREEPILKVFTVTGLDRVIAIHGSLAEAVAG